MYRVMIVDDERLIREGLKELIDWETHGFAAVKLASDGKEALEFQTSHPVDLIIADIRMPRMDGLDFLASLRSMGDNTRFLVLSGFAEFEYAQRAAAYRIDGYLLKPVDEEELIRHLIEVRRQLDGNRFTSLTLIAGTDRVPPGLDWGRWQVLSLVRVSATGQILAPDFPMEEKLRRVFRDEGWGDVFVHGSTLGALLRQVYPGGRNLDRFAKALGEVLNPEGSLFVAAVGPVVTKPSEVALSAARAAALLQDRFFLEPGTVAWTEPPHRSPGLLLDPGLQAEKLGLVLETGDPVAVREILGSLALGRTEQEVKEAASEVVIGAVERFFGREARSSTLRARDTAWIAEIWQQPFLSTLVEFLAGQLEVMVARERVPGTIDLAARLVEIIEVRYPENLKLESLAEVFHYNSAYLGKLFRTKTGVYFNTYLDQVRVRHAQELLLQGLKVCQVSEMVGYRYVDYFHTKFKKYTGLSPSQFRDQR